MKKTLIIGLITSKLIFATGIPVVDVVNNAQVMAQNIKEVMEWAEQASRWSEEISHYQNQIQAYQDQLVSQTGTRDSVQFTKDVEDFYNFSKNYNVDMLDIDSDILNSNSPIGNRAKALYSKYNLFDDCEEDYFTAGRKVICKNKMIRRVHEIAVYQEYNQNLEGISNNLNELSQKLANSMDIKESQDIGNAIQIVIARLELTKTKVELMNAQNARLDMIEKKQKEQIIKQTRGKSADFRKVNNK